MAKRLLGYLTDQHLALYETSAGAPRHLADIDMESAGTTLPRFLHRDKPLHLLADLVEMDFRFERAPALRGKDRQAFVQRKLQQIYRTTPYRHAAALGRETGKRDEEKLLFSAITNPDLITPWILPEQRRHQPVSGIAGLPQLQQTLRPILPMENPHLLLVTPQRRGGIRVTYFFEGEMRFSRLAPHPDSTLATLAGIAHEETVRTHQYLLSLRLVDRQDLIEVLSIVPEHELDHWRATQPSTGNLHFVRRGLREVATQLGLADKLPGETVDELYLALLVKASFPNDFSPPEERHGYQLYRLRRTLLASAGIITVAATLGSAALLFNGETQKGEHNRLLKRTQAVQTQIETVEANFPATEVPRDEIRDTLNLIRPLQQETPVIRRLFANISRGFDDVTQAELQRLEWLLSTTPRQLKPENLTNNPPPPAEGNPTSQNSDASPRRTTIAFVHGDIIEANSFEVANRLTERLRDAIIGSGSVEVDILRYPLAINAQAKLNEDLDAPIPNRLPFVMRVIWKQ